MSPRIFKDRDYKNNIIAEECFLVKEYSDL